MLAKPQGYHYKTLSGKINVQVWTETGIRHWQANITMEEADKLIEEQSIIDINSSTGDYEVIGHCPSLDMWLRGLCKRE